MAIENKTAKAVKVKALGHIAENFKKYRGFTSFHTLYFKEKEKERD
jgi:hypothetical protein